jgi:hypothetical protein
MPWGPPADELETAVGLGVPLVVEPALRVVVTCGAEGVALAAAAFVGVGVSPSAMTGEGADKRATETTMAAERAG